MGTIDIIFAGTSGFTAFYEPAKILDLPFLFDDAEEAYEVTNGEIGEKLFENFPQFGLIYLAEGDNGMRHLPPGRQRHLRRHQVLLQHQLHVDGLHHGRQQRDLEQAGSRCAADSG